MVCREEAKWFVKQLLSKSAAKAGNRQFPFKVNMVAAMVTQNVHIAVHFWLVLHFFKLYYCLGSS